MKVLTMIEKINKLAEKIREDKLHRLTMCNLACEANVANAVPKVVEGRKYTKIDVGNSGFIMIDNITGDIFGIKGYGVIHKGHKYGNLDTVDQWYWGNYYPVKKEG